MKTLALQQPWASLIASGIKDIENRTWSTPYRGKVLLVASSKKITRSFEGENPLEWVAAISNEQLFGNLPKNDELPLSAIVGYADLVEITQGVTDNVWDGQDPQGYKWRFENARLFNEPITGIKAKLKLYDTPEFNEDNLPPAHEVELAYPRVEGDTVVIHINKEQFQHCGDYPSFNILFDGSAPYLDDFVLDFDKFELAPIKTVCFECDGNTVSRKVRQFTATGPVDDNGNPYKHFSLFGGEIEIIYFSFNFE